MFRGQFCLRLSSYLFCVILIIGSTSVDLPAQQLQSETPSSPEVVQYDKQQRNDAAPLLYLGLIFLGLLLFGAMKGYKHAQKAGQVSQDVLQRKRQQLLRYIAKLDDQYAQGMLQEHAYSSERNQIKQQLVELTIQGRIIS
jgi:hypothetical protein